MTIPPNLKSRILDANATLQGWCSLEKSLSLAELILTIKPTIVVESGVFGGRSLIPMAQAMDELQNGVVIGLDPWSKVAVAEGTQDEANRTWWTQSVDLEAIMQGCQKAIDDLKLGNVCVIARCRSTQFQIGAPIIDLLHLDGNHSPETSCADLAHFMPQIRPHGYIAADDLHWNSMVKAKEYIEHYCDLQQMIETGSMEKGDLQRCGIYRRR